MLEDTSEEHLEYHTVGRRSLDTSAPVILNIANKGAVEPALMHCTPMLDDTSSGHDLQYLSLNLHDTLPSARQSKPRRSLLQYFFSNTSQDEPSSSTHYASEPLPGARSSPVPGARTSPPLHGFVPGARNSASSLGSGRLPNEMLSSIRSSVNLEARDSNPSTQARGSGVPLGTSRMYNGSNLGNGPPTGSTPQNGYDLGGKARRKSVEMIASARASRLSSGNFTDASHTDAFGHPIAQPRASAATAARRKSFMGLFSFKEPRDDSAKEIHPFSVEEEDGGRTLHRKSLAGSFAGFFHSPSGNHSSLARPSKNNPDISSHGSRKSRRNSIGDMFRIGTAEGGNRNSEGGSVPSRKYRDTDGKRRRSMADFFGGSSKGFKIPGLSSFSARRSPEYPDEEEDEDLVWFTSLADFKPLTFCFLRTQYKECYYASAIKGGKNHVLKIFHKAVRRRQPTATSEENRPQPTAKTAEKSNAHRRPPHAHRRLRERPTPTPTTRPQPKEQLPPTTAPPTRAKIDAAAHAPTAHTAEREPPTPPTRARAHRTTGRPPNAQRPNEHRPPRTDKHNARQTSRRPPPTTAHADRPNAKQTTANRRQATAHRRKTTEERRPPTDDRPPQKQTANRRPPKATTTPRGS
eukprot:gene2232-33714_t